MNSNTHRFENKPLFIIAQLLILGLCLSAGFVSCESEGHLYSGPITKTATSQAIANFNENYKTIAGLNYSMTTIQIDQNIEDLFTKTVNKPNEGLVFHYGLSSNYKQIFYIVGKGRKIPGNDDFSHAPFDDGTFVNGYDHYILLDGLSPKGYSIINLSDFLMYTANYSAKMKKRDSLFFFKLVKNITCHPLMVYHDGLDILEFFDVSAPNTSQLNIAHGSLVFGNLNEEYHMPCFLFSDPDALDDVDNTASSGSVFQNKSLDAGMLCPPYCNQSPSRCES